MRATHTSLPAVAVFLTFSITGPGAAGEAIGPCAESPSQETPLSAEWSPCERSGADLDRARPSEPVREYHPGHYISLNRFDGRAQMLDALQPGVVGIQKRYLWKNLEPEPGQYDFTEVQADLDLLAPRGAQLVVFITDKTFNGEIPTPEYLHKEHTLRNRRGGYTAMRWDTFVVERMKLLLKAIGQRFDCHPSFEGIAIQESSLSLDNQPLAANDYSPERYRDALIDILLSAAASMPRSQVFWYMNFLPGKQAYIASIAEAIAPAGIAMGGPDVLPDNRPLKTRTYPFYARFKDKMKLFTSVQYDSYAHRRLGRFGVGKYWTMGELFEFARDELHVDYIFWNRKTWRKPADSYDWKHALPVIEQTPRFNQPATPPDAPHPEPKAAPGAARSPTRSNPDKDLSTDGRSTRSGRLGPRTSSTSA